MARFKAELVVTYPNEEGEWTTLKLSRFEADYLRRALDLAMGSKQSNGRVENPKAYAE